MSVVFPGGSSNPDWRLGPKPKLSDTSKCVKAKIKSTEQQLPEESAGRLSPRTVTNMATKSATVANIEQVAGHAAGFTPPKMSKRDHFIDNMLDRLFHATLPKIGVSIPPVVGFPNTKTLERLGLDASDPYVQEKAALLEQLEAARSITPGRRLLLTQMLRKPEKLLDDLPSYSEVQVGSTLLRPKSTPEATVTTLGNELAQYIASKNPSLAKKANDCVDELLYAACHTFFKAPMERQLTDPRFKDDKDQDVWVQDSKRIVSKNTFEMEKARFLKPDTLLITRSKEIPYIPIGEGLEGEKRLIMQVECRYDLSNNKVSFTYTYNLDGEKETWRE